METTRTPCRFQKMEIRTLLSPLLVFILVFGLFAPSIGYPLVAYDDMPFIARNTLVLDGLSLASVKTAFTTLHGDGAMYSPLLWISWMLDVSVFGASPSTPWPFHFGNVLLHALNAVFLFFLLRRCRAATLPAVLLALLWACHPLRIESVAWATERKDCLSTFFAFLSILCYLKAFPSCGVAGAEPPPSACRSSLATCLGRKGFLALSFLFLLLGMLVKPMLVTLPFLFLLFDVFPLGRISLDRTFSFRSALRPLSEKIPFFLLSVAASAGSLLTQTRAIHHEASLLSRLALIPLHYAFYLIKTFLPIHLTPFYHPIVFSWRGVLPFLFLFAALFVSAWRRRASHPAWSLGILAFFGLFVPVIGFFHVGIHHIADRYAYLPAIGLSIAAIPFLSAGRPLLRRAATVLAVLALLALFPLTLRALPLWSSSDAFYERAGRLFPNHPSVVSWQSRALINDHADFAAAEALLDASLAEYPEDDQLRIDKALCLAERVGPKEAFDFLMDLPASSLTVYEFREAAQYALRAGLYDRIPPIVEVAMTILTPTDTLREELLYIQFAAGFYANDESVLRRTAALIPKLAGQTSFSPEDLFSHYVKQWAHLHRRDAWDYFRAAAQANRNSPPNLNNLAWILVASPGWNPVPPADALAIARRAAELAPNHPVILDTLAAALANAGDFPAAIDTATRALSLSAPAPKLAAKIRSHLDCYRQGKPFREDG